ncbi:MAG: protein kinase [Candidatus Riflebacteria bacterium]|nr:protein kinase [Candidatus Riflebacteria bacterium]
MNRLSEDPAVLARELGPEFARKYEILGVLGRGGMGVVLRARQKDLKRQVAVKLMLIPDPDMRARFQREGRLLARLRHPNIVSILDTGEACGHPYLVFELVEGNTLRDRLDRAGQLAIEDAVRMVSQVADGLAMAHEQGVLHRDVKCNNVMLTPSGDAKLADFGLALALDAAERITKSGIFMGTPEYTAPEVITGHAPAPASDLYSLGMVLYEAVAGSTSFGNLPLQDLMRAHLEREPIPLAKIRPDVPPWLDSVVRRLLAKDPRKRYQSAAQVVKVLADGLAGKLPDPSVPDLATVGRLRAEEDLDQTVRSGSTTARTRRSRHARRRLTIGLAAALGAGIGFVLVLALYFALRTRETPTVLVTDVRVEPSLRSAVIRWRTTPSVESQVELARDPKGENWKTVNVVDRKPAVDHEETLADLEPGREYAVRVRTATGVTSLAYPLVTGTTGEPSFEATATRARLVLDTTVPVLGFLETTHGRLREESTEPSKQHRFAVSLRDAILGLDALRFGYEVAPGQEAQVSIGSVRGLPKALADSVDTAAIGKVLRELYGHPKASDAEHRRILDQVRGLPFFRHWQQFRAIARPFFVELPWVSDPLRLEVFNSIASLECFDSAALDFHVPPILGYWQVVKPFASSNTGAQPFPPRFRWKTDFTKHDGTWVPEGDDEDTRRIRLGTAPFAAVMHDRHVFTLQIPSSELDQAREVAVHTPGPGRRVREGPRGRDRPQGGAPRPAPLLPDRRQRRTATGLSVAAGVDPRGPPPGSDRLRDPAASTLAAGCQQPGGHAPDQLRRRARHGDRRRRTGSDRPIASVAPGRRGSRQSLVSPRPASPGWP